MSERRCYVPRRLRNGDTRGPRWIITYPVDKRLTAGQAVTLKRLWGQASRSGVPLILPDSFKIERYRP